MHYTAKMKQEIAQKDAQIAAALETIQELRVRLASPKFHCGDDLDGYISTSEVDTELLRMRDNLLDPQI